jgi:hypothetical protein
VKPQTVTIIVLSATLLLAAGYAGFVTLAHGVGSYNARMAVGSQAGMLDAYDGLLCDLVCGKTIAEANAILGPDRIQASKKGLGSLALGGVTADVCLDGDIVTAIDSSHSVAAWPKCLNDAFFAEE